MAERTIPLRLSDFAGPAPNVEKCQCWLCANEKAALTTESMRLRAALEDIAYPNPLHNEDDLMGIARAALEGRT